MIEVFVLPSALLTLLCSLISRLHSRLISRLISRFTFLELAQGSGLVALDPFPRVSWVGSGRPQDYSTHS